MRSFLMRVLICLLIVVFCARAGSAQEVQPLDPEWVQRMYAEGWHKVQEGVLQRSSERGEIETFSYGAEGLQWLVQSHERRLWLLEEKYSESPDEKLAALIQEIRDEISRLNSDLALAPAAESIGLESLEGGCPEAAYSLFAWAGPQRSPRGVTAMANASFNSAECAGRPGRTHVDVYVQAKETTKVSSTAEDDADSEHYNGAEISSSVALNLNGSTDCKATAVAQFTLSDTYVSYSREKEHYGCPTDVTASISGPSVATTDEYASPCADVTWVASATGGTSPYSYDWYIDSTSVGSGTTLTKEYCATDSLLEVRLVARDANDWSDEETFQTELQHIGFLDVELDGPGQVTTNSTTPCVNVTWTASATEGHPGYTYKWYIGTGTTEEGTGGTFIKQYCSTNETVTVRVVATDADGHTAQGTKQMIITHVDPLTASISGPTVVTTDYYTSPCTNVSWAISASGGYAGGHTYEWFIGTSTTVQGTGATLTRQYCNTSTPIDVRAIVKDSHDTAVEDTHATNIQYLGPITSTISGPSTVNTNSLAPCATVTWTASANSAGHSGFTYTWYIGSTVHSGEALTRQYCSASQTITVRLVATASDGHTDDETKTTEIVYTPSPIVRISGPATVVTDDYTSKCADVTWAVSVTDGSPAYTYKWYIGGQHSTGSSTFTKRYCETNEIVNVRVVVTDGQSSTYEETFTTTVQHRRLIVGVISGLDTVNTANCADVTWSASASGENHSGYTYRWYFGTALQKIGDTFTKTYCNTSQPVTVKMFAVASDGHTSEVTKTTTLTNTPPPPPSPLTASISGIAQVSITRRDECTSLSWTASAAGGTPGYTYSWYLGTSSTVEGTGSTFSKTFCGPQSIRAKVVVLDSGSPVQTDDATFTTEIKRR